MTTRRQAAGKRGGSLPGHPIETDGSEYTADEIEFVEAMGDWIERTGRKFPTWCEVLGVLRSLGYRKESTGGVAPRGE